MSQTTPRSCISASWSNSRRPQACSRRRKTGARRTTSPAASADGGGTDRATMNEHTAKAFDVDLQELTRKVAEMGGLAEREIADAIQALTRRDVDLAKRVVAADPTIDACSRRSRKRRSSPSRAASRWRSICARWSPRCACRTISSGSATSPRTSASACRALDGDFHPQQADPRGRAHGLAGARPAQAGARRLCRAAICQARSRSGRATRRSTRCAPRCSASC